MRFIKIAFRNLKRYKRRTFFTGISMFVGCAILVFGQSFADGISNKLIANIISLNSGHISVTLKNDMKSDDTSAKIANWKKQIIKNPDEIEKKLEGNADISIVTKRITINGLLKNGNKISSGVFVGVEPEKELDLFIEGIPVDRGSILKKDDSNLIYISNTTADLYKLGLGDTLTLIAQTAGGEYKTMDFRVKGIFKKSPWKEYYSYITLKDSQSLAGLGDSITQFKVMLKNPAQYKAVLQKVNKDLAGKYNLNIKSWEEAAGFFLGTVYVVKGMVVIVGVALFVVIGAILMNTMSMAVFERTREIGTLMAMGTKRRQILILFFMEAMILSFIAAGLGVLLSGLLSVILGHIGVPAASDAMRMGFGADYAYPYLSIFNVLISFSAVVVLAIIASISPAIRASRLEPVKALSYV